MSAGQTFTLLGRDDLEGRVRLDGFGSKHVVFGRILRSGRIFEVLRERELSLPVRKTMSKWNGQKGRSTYGRVTNRPIEMGDLPKSPFHTAVGARNQPSN